MVIESWPKATWLKLNAGEGKWWKTLLTDWLILIIIFLITLIIIVIISLRVVYEDSVCSHCELSKYWSGHTRARLPPSPSCHSTAVMLDIWQSKCFTNIYYQIHILLYWIVDQLDKCLYERRGSPVFHCVNSEQGAQASILIQLFTFRTTNIAPLTTHNAQPALEH